MMKRSTARKSDVTKKSKRENKRRSISTNSRPSRARSTEGMSG